MVVVVTEQTSVISGPTASNAIRNSGTKEPILRRHKQYPKTSRLDDTDNSGDSGGTMSAAATVVRLLGAKPR